MFQQMCSESAAVGGIKGSEAILLLSIKLQVSQHQ